VNCSPKASEKVGQLSRSRNLLPDESFHCPPRALSTKVVKRMAPTGRKMVIAKDMRKRDSFH